MDYIAKQEALAERRRAIMAQILKLEQAGRNDAFYEQFFPLVKELHAIEAQLGLD